MKKLKKLPIGIQTFQDIREPKENYIYIDKIKEAQLEFEESYNTALFYACQKKFL